MRADYLKTVLLGLCFLLICGIVAEKRNKAHGHSKKSQSCGGGGTDRIVGGRVAGIGEFPYQVSIRNSGSHSCGGSLISNKWILTAAHCINTIAVSRLTAVVGTNYLSDGGTTYKIDSLMYHEDFDPSYTIQNDIGLLEVSGTVQLTDLVAVVPLSNDYPPEGSTATLTGWGYTSLPGSTPNDLQAIDLKTITVAQCNASLVEDGVGQAYPSSVCTAGVEGKGACRGDSGGPLVLNGSQIGILSWGTPCAQGKPDVYSSVSYHRSWIKSNSGV